MGNYTVTEELHYHHKKINQIIDLVNELLNKVEELEERIDILENGGEEQNE